MRYAASTAVLSLLLTGMASAQDAGGADSVARDSTGKRLGPVTSAIVTANKEAESKLKLVARIETQPDEIIEFYEPAPGRIFMSGAGAPDGRTNFDLLPPTAREAWKMLAPGYDMPEALQQAISREVDRTPNAEGGEPADGPVSREWGGGSQTMPQGTQPAVPQTPIPQNYQESFRSGGWCDTGFFQHNLGGCPTNPYDFKVCLNNWWDGAFAYHHDAFISYTVVCPATGTVVFRLNSNEFGDGLWTVDQDTYRSWSGIDNGCQFGWDDCPYVRADVEHAAGKRFHFRFGAVDE